MIVTRDLTDLSAAVAEMMFSVPGGVVSCDGFDGVGKSTLARALANQLGAAHLELDAFVEKAKGRYVEEIRYDELSRALGGAGRLWVVEGICVQKVLARVRVRPAATVYVKKLEPDGRWFRGDRYLPADRTPDEVIRELKEQDWAMDLFEINSAPVNAEQPDTVLHEIIRYHYEFQPHRNADVTFERVA